jgi:hypothetical protein
MQLGEEVETRPVPFFSQISRQIYLNLAAVEKNN